MTKHTPPFSPEVRERAARMVLDHQGDHGSQFAAIRSIAAKIGCSGETLRKWVRQAERDQGRLRTGPTTDERERIKGAGTRGPRTVSGQRAPEQALHERRRVRGAGLIHHSDRVPTGYAPKPGGWERLLTQAKRRPGKWMQFRRVHRVGSPWHNLSGVELLQHRPAQ